MKREFLLFYGLLLLFYSCADPHIPTSETTLQNEGVSCVDGVLYFRTPEDFFLTIEQATAPDADARQLETKYGFRSLGGFIEDICTGLEEIMDAETYEQAVAYYKNYIYVDKYGLLQSRFTSLGYNSVANKDGIYYIGDVRYRVTPDNIEVYSDPTTKSINSLKINYTFDADHENLNTRGERGDVFVERVYDANNNRWVHAYVRTIAYFAQLSDGTFDVKYTIQFHAKGYKKDIWAGYRNYKTILMFDNVVWSFVIPGKTGSYSTPSGYINSSYFSGDDHSWISNDEVKDFYVNYTWTKVYHLNYPYRPDVRTMRFRARSRGTGNCGLAVNFNVPAGYAELSECI